MSETVMNGFFPNQYSDRQNCPNVFRFSIFLPITQWIIKLATILNTHFVSKLKEHIWLKYLLKAIKIGWVIMVWKWSKHWDNCAGESQNNFRSLIQPLWAFKTFLICLDILCTSPRYVSEPIPFHVVSVLSHNSSNPDGGVEYWLSRFLVIAQRVSVKLRSGDCAGHTITSNSWPLNHSRALDPLWHDALSCWKITSAE